MRVHPAPDLFYMQLFLPMIAVLPDILPGVLGVIAATVLSFAAIVLISSYYRFQHIVQQAEDTQPEDMGVASVDVLRIQLARYLAGCARRGTSFSVSLIRMAASSPEVRMDSPFVLAVKAAARGDDITCVYDGQTAALLTEAEPDDSEAILARIKDSITESCPEITGEPLCVGIASYPGHGLSGKDLLAVAMEGLSQTNDQQPIVMPEIVDIDEEDHEDVGAESEVANEEQFAENSDLDEEEIQASKGWKNRRKNAMLDELTGVLKPSAVSAYMQRMMSDFRHKKKKAALFCMGVNNIDHISRFHGEDAADDVLVGVSKLLQDNLRADDLIGRHEKYAFLVLAQTTLAEAEIIGKRISTLVQQNEMPSGTKKLKTTISLGVAAYPEHGRNLHSLYQAGQKVLDYNRANDIRAYAVYDPEIHDIMSAKPMKSIKSIQA